MTLISILFVLLSVALCFAISFGLRERRRRKGRPFFDNSPVQLIKTSQIDPVFTTSKFGPSIETETALIGDTDSFASTNMREAWILCVLAKTARVIFEFGTCSGRTTYMLAKNSPEDALIGTITLSPDEAKQIQNNANDPDSQQWQEQALIESNYTTFLYTSTPQEKKITQLFVDSKKFDESEWRNKCDLIFIDGGHAYSYVKNDTEKAMLMVNNNGIIIWHDFSPACPGVWKYLSELAVDYPVKHIEGTRLGFLRWESHA